MISFGVQPMILQSLSSVTIVIFLPFFRELLAPGGISHSGPGENRQFWPDENSQS